jgi:hypothetical protein
LLLATIASLLPFAAHADTIEAFWSNPVLIGTIINPLTNQLTGFNNSTSAVVSISNGSAQSAINWGTWNANGITNPPGVPDVAGCAALAAGFNGTPCQSSLTFTGATLPTDTSVPFTLGTITYTNGTSNLDSLAFGATLTFMDSQTSEILGSDQVAFNTTQNLGTVQQQADYITFSGLSGVSFNVEENATATATATGHIDGLVLDSLTVTGGTGGFIGDNAALPAVVPEPASLGLLGTGFAILGVLGRRRRSK